MVTQQQALDYFTKENPSAKMILYCIAGIVIGLGSLFFGDASFGIIIIIICIGLIYYFGKMLGKFPTDADIDKSFLELMDIRQKEATKKLDLQEDEMVESL